MESKGSMLKLSLCHLLLSFSVSSAGSFVVNVTQSWYHAEQNHNISLEWMFPTSTDPSPNALHVFCEMLAPKRHFTLFHLHEGVEVPEMQDKRFAGRVQWDKDVLREGRLRLHISRLQTNDSGLYWCEVSSGNERNSKECHLNVTAANEPDPVTLEPAPTTAVKDRPEPETTSDTRLRWIGLYCVLGLTAALLVSLFYLCFANKTSDQQNKRYTRNTIQVIDPLSVCTETV